MNLKLFRVAYRTMLAYKREQLGLVLDAVDTAMCRAGTGSGRDRQTINQAIMHRLHSRGERPYYREMARRAERAELHSA